MKRVVVLGSTGSIGTQTLDVIRDHPTRLEVVGLAAHSNSKLLLEQANRFRVKNLALYDERAASTAGIPGGMNSIVDLATAENVDIVVVSVAGVIGLLPTIAAIRAGKDIALASKEVLVAAGEIVMPLVQQNRVKLTPIDSEHSAIFQCLQGSTTSQVEELILTASGGPFRGWPAEKLRSVTSSQALNHPTWNMGGKITIDSATLMNKGLETIEAKWLFNLDIDSVKIVVHPQSIIHSMVKFRDGSVLGQMGWPNMCLPIQYALLHPDRVENTLPNWNPIDSPPLSFESFDETAFRSPSLARESVHIGRTMPAAMNASNEEAANAFLRGAIGFLEIPEVVEGVMQRHIPCDTSLENLLETDRWAREASRELMAGLQV